MSDSTTVYSSLYDICIYAQIYMTSVLSIKPIKMCRIPSREQLPPPLEVGVAFPILPDHTTQLLRQLQWSSPSAWPTLPKYVRSKNTVKITHARNRPARMMQDKSGLQRHVRLVRTATTLSRHLARDVILFTVRHPREIRPSLWSANRFEMVASTTATLPPVRRSPVERLTTRP